MPAPIAAAAAPSPEESRTRALRDRAILERYTDQPAAMPRALRASIEKRFLGRPVQLYALADLDAALRLGETWIALGPREIAVASLQGDRPEIRTFPRSSVSAVRLEPGLTCNVLTLLGAAGEPALARVRFTHRQRRAMENLQFALEQDLEGRPHRGRRAGRPLRGGRGRPDPRRAGPRGRQRRRGALAPARLPAPLPRAGGVRHGVGGAADGALADPSVPHGLPDRRGGAPGPGRERRSGRRARDGLVGGGGDRDRPRPAPALRLGAPALDGDPRRARRARPADGALRAPAAPLARLLLAQEDRQPDHAGHRRHRPALGVPGARRGGRVARR